MTQHHPTEGLTSFTFQFLQPTASAAQDWESGFLEIKSLPSHLPAGQPGARHLTSLCSKFCSLSVSFYFRYKSLLPLSSEVEAQNRNQETRQSALEKWGGRPRTCSLAPTQLSPRAALTSLQFAPRGPPHSHIAASEILLIKSPCWNLSVAFQWPRDPV